MIFLTVIEMPRMNLRSVLIPFTKKVRQMEHLFNFGTEDSVLSLFDRIRTEMHFPLVYINFSILSKPKLSHLEDLLI